MIAYVQSCVEPGATPFASIIPLTAGFAGYIEKPFRYKEFLASVAALLGGGE